MAVINFQNNQTVDGTSGNDTLMGNDTAGNNNDIVYGHQGTDFIEFSVSLNNSTLYGGQDNDLVSASNGSALYGNFGNDILEVFGNTSTSVISSSDALYGGQGDDFELTSFSTSDVLYGNLGNDTLFAGDNSSFIVGYGGQGHDILEESISGASNMYGNQGNDIVEDSNASGYNAAVNNSFSAEGSSVLYGGQGDDTLVAVRAGGDTMWGGLGQNLFAGNAVLSTSSFTANDLITVEGFQTGNGALSLSTSIGAQTLDPNSNGFLTKIEDTSAANAVDAMVDANSFYLNNDPNFEPAYVFVYGGSGAGYLFYNGDAGDDAVNDGMILAGANAEGSLQASDVVASNFATAV